MRRCVLVLATAAAVALCLPAASAQAVTCPNPVPVIDENACQGPGSSAWRLTNHSSAAVAGFSTETSVDRGQDVTLKMARSGGPGSADVTVFRMGYYGGTGGRLVHSATAVPVTTGSLNCAGESPQTGLENCNNWASAYTIPASALPASGIYLVRLRDRDNGTDNHVIFTVRDDQRSPQADVLYTLPVATYQAYNGYTDKSLYDAHSSGPPTALGGPRASHVSFDRPYKNVFNNQNWFLKSDYSLVWWLERQGYDVSYTDSVAVDQAPSELSQHGTLVLSGHDEYWSADQMNGYKAARGAGVDIASFSANTAYWQVRYEDGGNTMVCYKTVQGAGGNGALGVNDPGPDGVEGTGDDALGADLRAGTADDRPEIATTTFRDNGAAPGDPNAPVGGRVGPNAPENSLFGSLYMGDNDAWSYPLAVPPGNPGGEFAADRIWRRTGISEGSGASIGSKLVGWEWDAVPIQSQYLTQQPGGVKRLALTDTVAGAGNPPNWIQDEGRVYATTPPPGQGPGVGPVKYAHSSGALVFSAGTNQWAWGLGPHFIDSPGVQTYLDSPVNSADPRIEQATYNILADTGARPGTPAGVTLDGIDPPTASLTIDPNPAGVGQQVSFDGSGSQDTEGPIARYEWDLDGNGSFETDTGTNPGVTRTYASEGSIAIRLRVTDGGGQTDEETQTLVVGAGGSSAYSSAVNATPGLSHYWRMGESAGGLLVDSRGGAHASLSGPALGAPGAIGGSGYGGGVRWGQ